MRKSRRRAARVAVTAAIAALVTAVVPACAPEPVACAPVAYSSTLKVTIEGSEPHDVQLCRKDVCAPSRAASEAGLRVVPADVSGQTWTFMGQFPQEFTIAVFAGDGLLVAETDVEPSWTRTGGSAACGGPTVAEVTVRIAA